VPRTPTDGVLWRSLSALWPSYLAFLMSFFVILIMWVNHHDLIRLVRAVDYQLMFANGFVLLTVTFVPFPTAILAQHLHTAAARAKPESFSGGSAGVEFAFHIQKPRRTSATAAPTSKGRRGRDRWCGFSTIRAPSVIVFPQFVRGG